MISEHYIKDGIRIRKEYLKNLKKILELEPFIMEKKKVFESMRSEMEYIVKFELKDIKKTLELNEKLLSLDKEMKDIQDVVRPFHDNIEKLKSDRDRLYVAIKEKYPGITVKQIEYEIMSKVEE